MAIPDRIGRYRVVRLLGTGATSSVFLAHDAELDVDVAVKVLADNLVRREDLVQRFLQEARLLRDVVDERVIAVHDIGVLDNGQPYFVMDLGGEGSLAERLAARDAIDRRAGPNDALAIGRELARGVDAVHRRGLVHGDLKPDNVFVRDAGDADAADALIPDGARLVLGDFGLAGPGTPVGAGTIGYAPPEQARGEAIDPRTDLYSCSAIVHRVLTGRAPSDGIDPELRRRHRPLAAFLATGLAPDPAARPADAAAWLDGLERATARDRRRWARAAVGAVAVMAAVAVVAAVATWRGAGGAPRLIAPAAVAAAPGGVVLAGDPEARAVFEIDGTGVGPTRGSAGLSARAVAPRSGGPLLVADTAGNRVVAIATDGRRELVAGNGRAGFGGDGGPAEDAELRAPAGVAVSGDGSTYIADTGNYRIRRVSPRGVITTYAGTGQPGNAVGPDPLATELDGPTGLALDAFGALLVADTGNNRALRIETNGNVEIVAGTGFPGFSGDGGRADEAELRAPRGVAAGAGGAVYVADTRNNRIRRVDAEGTIATLAGTGTAGYAGDGGRAEDARLQGPEGVAAGSDGAVLVADTGNGRVRRIDPDGTITTVAGG